MLVLVFGLFIVGFVVLSLNVLVVPLIGLRCIWAAILIVCFGLLPAGCAGLLCLLLVDWFGLLVYLVLLVVCFDLIFGWDSNRICGLRFFFGVVLLFDYLSCLYLVGLF